MATVALRCDWTQWIKKNTELKQDINQEDNLGGIYRFNIECKSSGSVHIIV